jgi:hypothetical protein
MTARDDSGLDLGVSELIAENLGVGSPLALSEAERRIVAVHRG